MTVSWLFEVNTYKMSTQATDYGGLSYSAKIIPESFKGITMKWDLSGHLMSPGQLTFEISNVNGAIGRSDLEGYDLTVRRVVSGVESRAWKFKVQRAVPYYGKMKCFCVDFLKAYLEGQWPNTPHPKEVWPSDDTDPDNLDDACIPVILGTAYIPIMSVNTGVDRYYVLGEDGPTYTIDEVRSPREIPVDVVYASASYAFNQSIANGYKLAQFIIADSDGDGAADANGLWESGSGFYPPLVKLSRSDTAALTGPEQWLEYILEDFGVAPADIDTGAGSTFESAGVDFSASARAQTFNGGFWKRHNRERLLTDLLRMCDSFLVVTDKIELHPFSATPIETISKADVKKLSYSPSPLTQSPHDGGRVSWAEAGKPQDKLTGKAIVPLYEAQATISAPSGEVFEYAYGQDSADAQRAAILHFAKKYLQKDRITLKTSCNKITNIDTLLPGQVLTLDDAIFGASFDLIIESLSIAPDDTVSITGVRLSHVEDWSDISALEITVTGDSSSGWRVAVLRSDGVVDADVNWSRIQDDDGHRPDPDADVTANNPQPAAWLTDGGALATFDSIDTSYVTDAGDLATVDADALVYFSSTAPTTPANHPLWGDTSSAPYKLKRWSGTAWEVIATLNTGALADLDVVDFSSLADDGGTLEISNSVLRVLGADGIQLEPGADLFVDSESGNPGSIYFLTAAGKYVEVAANYDNGALYLSPKTNDTSGLWIGYDAAGRNSRRFSSIVNSAHSLSLFAGNRYSSQGDIRLDNFHEDVSAGVDHNTVLWVNPSNVDITDLGSPAGNSAYLNVRNTIYPYNGIAFGGPGNDVLDDYEEGVYTVTCAPATSGTVTLDATYDTLAYTKIGQKATIQGRIYVGSISSPVGTLKLSLPFAVANLTEGAEQGASPIAFSNVNIGASGTILSLVPISSTEAWFVISQPGGAWSWLDGSALTGNEAFRINFSYIAA
jgi:hypothetical protein